MQYSNLPADGASLHTAEHTLTGCEFEWAVNVHFVSECVEKATKNQKQDRLKDTDSNRERRRWCGQIDAIWHQGSDTDGGRHDFHGHRDKLSDHDVAYPQRVELGHGQGEGGDKC